MQEKIKKDKRMIKKVVIFKDLDARVILSNVHRHTD